MRLCLSVLITALALGIAPADAAPLAGTKPNIILVITDDQGFPPVGANGHPWINTPNLNQLHDTSTRFTRFLVSPTCSPTRSSIMCGRPDIKNGITHTIFERERMTLDATILPQVLKAAGYTTGIFGKWHLGDEEPYQPQSRGFDEVFIHGAGGIGQVYDCSCADAPNNSYYEPVIRHNGKFVKTHGYCTDMFFTAALGWIKEKQSQKTPFFAYIATNAPHGPFNAPPKNAEKFAKLGFGQDQAGFYGMIENVDENMGRLLGKLGEWKLFDNTVVIFMSDNGMVGGGSGKGVIGHQPDGKPMEFYNAGMKGLKSSPDEGGVRVPFYIRWDGHLQPGRDIDRIAAHIDILPTLTVLAGGKLPEKQVEGRSLVPLLENASADWQDRYLFTHPARWDIGAEPNDFQWKRFAVRSQEYRLVQDELFDMEKDPGQTTDVSAQHKDVVDSMRAAFDKYWKEARPLMVNEGVPMSPTRPFYELYYKQEKSGGIPDWQEPKL